MSTRPEFVSRDFRLDEFAVSASFPHLVKPVPFALIPRVEILASKGLQIIRDDLERPMRILSGFRPHELNRAVAGSPTSQHVVAEAADFTCEDIRNAFIAVQRLVLERKLMALGQIIYYPAQSFIHVALASGRWPIPTCCVHWPERKLTYRVLSPTGAKFAALVPEQDDPSVRRVA